MERVVLLSDVPVITAEALDLSPGPGANRLPPARTAAPPLPDAVEALERQRCEAALREASWNLTRAAARLGIPRNTLRYRIEKYALRPADAAPDERGRRQTAALARPPATIAPQPPAASTGHPRWERRHVALLRLEIARPAGEPALHEAYRWVAALGDKAETFGGCVKEVGPTGFLAVFGLESSEDAARRAADAALAMIRAAARHADGVRSSRASVNVAVHVDHVLVRSSDSGAVIDAQAKLAAWTELEGLLAHSTPDAAVVSATAVPFLERRFTLEPMAGDADIGRACLMRGLEPTGYGLAGRPLSLFVGRAGELALLSGRLDAAAMGHGQMVGIIGEPGVGKSRLIYECTRLARPRGWRLLECRGVSYRQTTPYGPLLDLLRGYFAVDESQAAPGARDRIFRSLESLDPALGSALPAFLSLLDVPVGDVRWQALDPRQRRQRTLEALSHLWLREAERQPVLLVVEDLHWGDTETHAALESLMERLATFRLFLLVSYRPEHEPGWTSRRAYTQLRLGPLPASVAEELVPALVGATAELAPLRALLIARTAGNPFFLEETVRALVESGVLAGARGAYRLARVVDEVEVPPSVRAVLSARIDRLPDTDRRLLSTAAVIGKDVPHAVLRRVTGDPEEAITAGLGRLVTAEFLAGAAPFPDSVYTFKHALTHDVAYTAVPLADRRDLHRRVVAVIEALQRERLGEHVDALVHHAVHGELWDEAAAYLRQAGARAVARSAFHEAAARFQQALTTLERLGQVRDTRAEALDVRMSLGPVLIALHGASSPDVEQSYRAAEALCRELDDARRLFPILWGLWYVTHNRGQYAGARQLAAALLDVAKHTEERAVLLEAHHSTWSTLFAMGRPAEAEAHCREGIRLYEPALHGSALLYGGHDPGTCARGIRASVLWELGYPDQAIEQSRDAVRLAGELDHPLTTMIILYGAARIQYHRGEREAAIEAAERSVALGRALDVAVWTDQSAVLLGHLLVQSGKRDAGLEQIRAALPRATGTGWTWGAVFSAAVFVSTCLDVGDIDGGLAVLAELAVRGDEGHFEPELHRLRGELVLARAASATDYAAACFTRALDIARARQARSLELRVAMSLSRLQHRLGRHDEARHLLREIYGTFTEGHDTRDLRDAKELLAQLS